MLSGCGDFQCSPRTVLSTHVGHIGDALTIVLISERRNGIVKLPLLLQIAADLEQAGRRFDPGLVSKSGLLCIGAGQHQRAPARLGTEGGRQTAVYGTQLA